MKTFRDFINDKRGIFWEVTIGVTVLLTVDIIYFVTLLVLNAFKANFLPMAHDPAMMTYLSGLTSTAGIVTVVVLNLGIMFWMAISAHKRETQDYPEYM